jgi:uncharacterized RDD family membrane protein YckC
MFILSIWIFIGFVGFSLPILICYLISRYKPEKNIIIAEKTYEFATLLRRFFAFFIDNIIINCICGFILYFLIFFMYQDFIKEFFKDIVPIYYYPPKYFFIRFFIIHSIYFLSLCIVEFLYKFLAEGRWGKTLGKLALGIVVISKENGSLCKYKKAFIRNILRVVDSFFFYLVGVIVIAFNKNWQRLGDILAKTLVVKSE